MGCRSAACPHSREPIGKVGLLGRSMQMQLIKRGGPKGGTRIGSREEADKRLAALRQEHDAEEASKRAGEAAAAGALAPAAAAAAAAKATAAAAKKCGECDAHGQKEDRAVGEVEEARQEGAAPPFGWVEALEEPKDFNPAELEEHFRLTMQGPDAKWLANHNRAKQQRASIPDSPTGAQEGARA
eukprot:6089448-Pyramimonas_sp.AAC.1